MFTIEQISEAGSKTKSGADFPAFVQAIIKLGVTGYSTYVKDGHTEYFGKNNYRIQSGARYNSLEVADESNPENFKAYLKTHQQGLTDYPTFCQHSAETGVEKWVVDTDKMTCTYFDKKGNEMLVEKIPER